MVFGHTGILDRYVGGEAGFPIEKVCEVWYERWKGGKKVIFACGMMMWGAGRG